MRAIKILTVTLTLAASLVVGVSGTADASPHGGSKTVWCC